MQLPDTLSLVPNSAETGAAGRRDERRDFFVASAGGFRPLTVERPGAPAGAVMRFGLALFEGAYVRGAALVAVTRPWSRPTGCHARTRVEAACT